LGKDKIFKRKFTERSKRSLETSSMLMGRHLKLKHLDKVKVTGNFLFSMNLMF